MREPFQINPVWILVVMLLLCGLCLCLVPCGWPGGLILIVLAVFIWALLFLDWMGWLS